MSDGGSSPSSSPNTTSGSGSNPGSSGRSSSSSSSSTQGSGSGSSGKSSGSYIRSPDQSEIRALVDSTVVGGLIGRGGANVRRVREESGAQVSILKAETRSVPHRLLLLRGKDENIVKAVQALAQLIVESEHEKEKKDNTQDGKKDGDAVTLKILVHKSVVGALIGKGGASIKETQNATGTRLQISNDVLPNSTEKSVAVIGSPDAVSSAVSRILKQIKDNPIKQGVKVVHYVPGQPVFPNNLNASLPYPIPGQLPLFLPSLQFGGGNVGGAGAAGLNAQLSTQKIAIPTVCAGAVIGKGGQTIRDIRAQSGASISVADAEQSNPGERVVTLTGAPHSIQTAVYLIRHLVEQYNPNQY